MSRMDKRREWVLAALDEHEVRLVRYALSLVGDLDLARDAVQHAFVELCGQPVDAIVDHLAAWLFRVCRNRALDHLRRAGREQSLDRLDRLDEGGSPAWPVSEEPDPAETTESRELADRLRDLVAELVPAQREALGLWCEGFAYREIGEITGRQEGHVRVLVHRGLARLREHPQVRGWLEEERTDNGLGGRGSCRAGLEQPTTVR